MSYFIADAHDFKSDIKTFVSKILTQTKTPLTWHGPNNLSQTKTIKTLIFIWKYTIKIIETLVLIL